MHYTLQLLLAVAFITAIIVATVTGAVVFYCTAVVLGCYMVMTLDKS